jgi:hypothetical protein
MRDLRNIIRIRLLQSRGCKGILCCILTIYTMLDMVVSDEISCIASAAKVKAGLDLSHVLPKWTVIVF